MSTGTPTTMAPAYRRGSIGWWVHDADGRLAVAQFPNPALWVWLAAVVAGLLDLPADDARRVEGIRAGALIVWALDEVTRGTSPFRRALGVVVLVGQLVLLVTRG